MIEIDTTKIGLYLQNLVVESKKFIDSDDMMIVPSALSMMSVILGNRIHTYDGSGSELYPNLWVMIIAKSGLGSKSTTIKTLNKMILKSVIEKNQYDYNKKYEAYKSLSKELKNQEEKPRVRQIISGQGSTFQGTIKALENNPNGLLALYDEARELLKKLNKDTEHKASLTSLYDQDYYGKDLVGSEGTGSNMAINNPFLSILAVTNPDWFLEEVKESDYTSGFFNRFSIIEIQKLPKLRAFKNRIKQDFTKFQECSLNIYKTLDKNFSIKKPLILDTSLIEDKYANWFDKKLTEYENNENINDASSSFLIRQLVAALKYAMIIQVYDYAYLKKDITQIRMIEPNYMDIGIYLAELFMKAIENHIEYIGLNDNGLDHNTSKNNLEKLADKIERYLVKRYDEEFQRSCLNNNIRGLNAKNFDYAMELAIKMYPYIQKTTPATNKNFALYKVDIYEKNKYDDDPIAYRDKIDDYDISDLLESD